MNWTKRFRMSYRLPLNLLGNVPPGDDSASAVIHRFCARDAWRGRSFGVRLGILAAAVVWPFVLIGMVVEATYRNGRVIARRTGRGVPAQLLDQLWAAWRYGILPRWYYIFEIYDDDKRRNARHYINKHEMNPTVYDLLRGHVDPRPASPLRNKLKFAARCKKEGLPVIPVLAMFTGAGPRWIERTESAVGEGFPPVDLFVKPVNDSSGRGAESWDAMGPGRYRRTDGKTLAAGELIEHIRQLCGSARRFIVQPRAVNHPDLADLNNGALATVRVLTCRNEAGAIECTHAVLRMAVGDNVVVDNFHAGGVAASVDLVTGELGPASDLGLRPERGWCDVHPNTGAPIRGRKLPHWQEIVGLAIRAHESFSDRTLVGWDVALLAEGPTLVEAQGRSDLDIVQRICERGLGDTRCGELLAHHIACAERSRAPANAG